MRIFFCLFFFSIFALPHARANTISGTVRYRDKLLSPVDGTVTGRPMLPARYVTLNFVRTSALGTVLGTAATDENGAFTSPDIGAHADIVVLVLASGVYQQQTAAVRDQSAGAGSTQAFQSGEFNLSGGNLAGQAIDINDDDIAGAFNIYDMLIAAHKYVREQFFAVPPAEPDFTVSVRWESGLDAAPGMTAVTCFAVIDGVLTINIIGNSAIDSDEFDDAVILHEYGHLAAYLYSEDDSDGGAHTVGETLDLRMAWSEGWATFFSSAVRNTEYHVDSNAGIAFIYEIDTPSVTGAPGLVLTGPENALAVSAAVWDILNSGIAISEGAVDTTREAIWDVFATYLQQVAPLDVTMERFWDGFFEAAVTPAYGADHRAALNAIINAHSIKYFIDSLEPNSTSAAATALAAGVARSATFYYDPSGTGLGAGDNDWYSFAATTGETYTFETLNLSNSADTVMQLYSTDGASLLAMNDNIATGNLASKIIFQIPLTGTYYLKVYRSTNPLPVVNPESARGAFATYGAYDVRVTAGGSVGDPIVADISPDDDAEDVSIVSTITVTFSQPVQASTVTSTSFTVARGETLINGTITLNSSRTVATFTPAPALLSNTEYTVSLTSDILDDLNHELVAFTSAFTTAASVDPGVTVPKVPRAQIAAGPTYVDVEWVYPAGGYEGVIVAYSRTRFPSITAEEVDGTTSLVVANGTEVYRGATDTTVRISAASGERIFVTIWTYLGSGISKPVYLASRAARGGQGIINPLNPADPDEDPPPGVPTLPVAQKFQAVSGDGFVDVEWVPAAGQENVIIAVGRTAFPKLELVTADGTSTLTVTRGTELFRGTGRTSFRLTATNGEARLFTVWTYNGIEFSRALYAATRASRGGKGLTERLSFYSGSFTEPEPLN